MTWQVPTQPLEAFLGSARWFSGKGRRWRLAGGRRLGEVPGAPEGMHVVVDVVEVAYDDAGAEAAEEHYQVPLACYAAPQDRLVHAFVGEWDDPDLGRVHAYDAVHDREAMQLVLKAFAGGLDGARPANEAEGLVFHRLPGHDLDLSVHSTVFSGEQSNSSVAFGEDSLLKVFRKVTPGPNPDISVHRVLTEAGSDHVAHLYGWLQAGEYQLAMLQQFLRTGSDGWDLALSSVRNLFAEADLHAEEVGGDFAAEAARLGVALAETHASLAEHFPTHVRTAEEMAELAASMHGRLDAALEVVPELAEHAAGLRATYDGVAGLPGTRVQTIHGDLHLGQTLRTVRGWKIVDFEGEPAKPLAERLLPDSPWRDVAGMLRSFDYAPQVVSLTSYAPEPDDAELEQITYRATEWAARNSAAFLEAYAGHELTAEERTLLAAHVADKAVYEAVYERRHRPTWVQIPLAALARLETP